MSSSRIPATVAAVPLLFAAMCDPEAASFAGAARDVTVGLGLAVDRSWSLPLPQLIAPLATLIPLGSLDLRAAIVLALPAALASYLVATRIVAAAGAASILALAFSATTSVLLAASPLPVALMVLAIELALMERSEHALGASTLVAAWGAPRLLPLLVVLWLFTRRERVARAAVVGALPVAALLLVPVLLRRDGWLAVGNALRAPSFAATPLPSAAILRAAVVVIALGALARALLRSPSRAERLSPILAATALGCALLLRAGSAVVVAAAALAPLAVTFAGALSIAVERHLARPGRMALTWLVPALALGLGARAFEVEAGARRLGDAAAAHDLGSLVIYGLAPSRAVLIVEDEPTLLAFADARLLHGLRPDLRVLPAQTLAAGGAARMTNETLAAIPAAADPLRALLAHATLEPADVAPLAQKSAVLAAVPAHRLKGTIARHAMPTGGPLLLALERVDPSDRRIRRPGLERRLTFLAGALAARPADDRLRALLRVSATREARVLSVGLDREGSLAALARAGSLGADPQRIARWTARVAAKQTLESEPESEDD